VGYGGNSGIRKKNGINSWMVYNGKPQNGSKWMVYYMKTLVNMDDLGVPTFVKTPIYGHVSMSIYVTYIVGKSENRMQGYTYNDIL
jgi:hypothetical protein